jgi:hypothetical protein
MFTVFPPVLGQKSVEWPDVFKLVKQPKELWRSWGPSKQLDNYTLDELWQIWTVGEVKLDQNGNQTGKKPPLRLVEQHFGSRWRSAEDKKVSMITASLYIYSWPTGP